MASIWESIFGGGDKATTGSANPTAATGSSAMSSYGPAAILGALQLAGGLFGNEAEDEQLKKRQEYEAQQAALNQQRAKELLGLNQEFASQNNLRESVVQGNAMTQNARNAQVNQLNTLAQLIQSGYFRGTR